MHGLAKRALSQQQEVCGCTEASVAASTTQNIFISKKSVITVACGGDFCVFACVIQLGVAPGRAMQDCCHASASKAQEWT